MADVYNNGMSLREAKKLAVELGVTVSTIKGTGEVRFSYLGLAPVKQNNRRKDATRPVVTFLRAAAALRAATAPNAQP